MRVLLPQEATRGQRCYQIWAKVWKSQTAAEVKTGDFKAPRGANNSCLHDVEKDLLPQAVLAFKELVLRVGAGDISADQLLTGRRHLQQLRVLVLHRHVSSVTQQLPDNGPEMMGNTFPDQLLVNKRRTVFC